jgi:hypothetical protein
MRPLVGRQRGCNVALKQQTALLSERGALTRFQIHSFAICIQ